MSTEFQKARRFVLRRLEEYLMESLVGQYEWLTEIEDGTDKAAPAVVRARLKAIASVRRELDRRGDEPGEK